MSKETLQGAELWWLLAAFLFGMVFCMGIASAWFVYNQHYSEEEKLWWAAISFILLIHERVAYAQWRKRVQDDLKSTRAPSGWTTNMGDMFFIQD